LDLRQRHFGTMRRLGATRQFDGYQDVGSTSIADASLGAV
jgi:hypothetical protein